MLIWDDSQLLTKKFCQDNSVEGLAFQDMLQNAGYKKVLVELGRQVTEEQAELTNLANQRRVQVPPDLMTPKSLELLDGTTRTPITEEPSDDIWAAMISGNQQGRPVKYHYRPRFGVGGGLLEFYPMISSNDYIIGLTYEASERDLSQAKVKDVGTVSLEHGSEVVTGSGTSFKTDMAGRYFCIGGDKGQRLWYRIRTVISDSELRLEQYYHGADVNEAKYTIAEIFALPEDCHFLPAFYAAWMWWSTKGNVGKTKLYEGFWLTGIAQAKKTHALTTRDNSVGNTVPSLSVFTEYPAHYPTMVTE